MKSPAYAGFDFHATKFCIYAGCMSPRQTGQLMQRIRTALDAGDVAFLRSLPFVGRIYRPRAKRAGVSPSVRRAILERDGARCRYCQSEARLEIDHVIPVIWGGTDAPENLQVLCKPCNLAKGPRVNEPRPSENAA